MRRIALLSTVALAGLLATNALAETTVTGQNWVGYVKLPTPPPGDLAMIGVNFEGVGNQNGEGIPLNEFFNTESLVDNQLQWALRDLVLLWDPVELKYNSYRYHDGNFHLLVDPATNTYIESNPIVMPGEALWLRSPTSGTRMGELYALGQVNLSSKVDITVHEGIQLMSYPYPVDMDFNDLLERDKLNWIVSGATANPLQALSSDSISVFEDGSYRTFYLRPDNEWVERIDNQNVTVDNIVIPAGTAFWYRARNGFTLELQRPFEL